MDPTRTPKRNRADSAVFQIYVEFNTMKIFDFLIKVKKIKTIQILVVAIFAFLAIPASAQAPNKKIAATVKDAIPDKGCTTRPKSEWLSVEEMALLARHRGYKFERVKIPYESCYEIYGTNQAGDLVEAYFDPSNAKLVRQNVVVLPKK